MLKMLLRSGSDEEAVRFVGETGLSECDLADFEPCGCAFARMDQDGADRSFSEVRSAQSSNAFPEGARVRQSQLATRAVGSAPVSIPLVPNAGIAIRFSVRKPYCPNPPALYRDNAAHGVDESCDASFRRYAGRVKSALARDARPG